MAEKNYTEQAIQTDFLCSSPIPCAAKDSEASAVPMGPCSPSVVESHRNPKPVQFSYNRPSQNSGSPSKRVVSLPEASSQVIRDTYRISSLPDYTKLSHSYKEDSFSSEYLESSASFDGSHISHGSARIRRSFPHSIQTPSPPSSPESIMIIGNNNDFQYPASLIRQKIYSRSKYNSNDGTSRL